MVFSFLRKRQPESREAAPVIAALPEQSASPVSAGAGEVVDTVEADVLLAIRNVGGSIASAQAEVAQLRAGLEGIRAQMGTLVAAAQAAETASSSLAVRTGSLSETSERITGAMGEASGHLDRASDRGAEARALISSLAQAGNEIAGIVDTISAVARQTNLLALNATIEAARAGQAGRGFAIVANEVKALSVETAKAAEDVRARVTRLRDGALSSGAAVEAVASAIESARPAFATVRSIAQVQAETVGSLVDEAERTSGLVTNVSGNADDASTATVDLDRTADAMARATARATDQADGLGRRFLAVIRQSEIGDRRRFDRYPIDLSVRLADGRRTRSVDLSAGGVLLAAPDGAALAVGGRLVLDIETIGRFPATVVATSPMGVHCAFGTIDAAVQGSLLAGLAAIETEYAPLIEKAQAVAARIAGVMEAEITAGRLPQAALFDTDYRLIAGTNPEQFRTSAVAPLEAVLPAILEPVLVQDNRMLFCIVTDRNGFVPVHNRRVSQPQRPGDAVWNNANCRNLRIFDDRTGITAARSTRPARVQVYRREVGDQIIMVREVDAPIRVFGRHWGACRTAYRL